MKVVFLECLQINKPNIEFRRYIHANAREPAYNPTDTPASNLYSGAPVQWRAIVQERTFIMLEIKNITNVSLYLNEDKINAIAIIEAINASIQAVQSFKSDPKLVPWKANINIVPSDPVKINTPEITIDISFIPSFLVMIVPPELFLPHEKKWVKIKRMGIKNILMEPKAYDSNTKKEFAPYKIASINKIIHACLFFVESIRAPKIPMPAAIVKIKSQIPYEFLATTSLLKGFPEKSYPWLTPLRIIGKVIITIIPVTNKKYSNGVIPNQLFFIIK